MAASSELRSPETADPEPGRGVRVGGRAALGVGVALLVLLCVAVGVGRSRGGEDRHLRHAQQLVADDDNFDTATDSGVTFTQVSTALEAAGDRCRPAGSTACNNLFAAAGYARVSAVGVLRCTRPGVFDARASMKRLLDDLQADEATARIPAVIRCR